MLCGFREVSRFVKTTRIHLKRETYLHCTVEIGHFALYPVRLKSISDPFKNIRNETIYQCESAHREYSSVNDINDIIQVLCHVVDLTHGFVTSWENVLFTLENIGTCVKITWNYFPCLVLHKVKVFIDYAQGFMHLLLLIFTLMISFLHCLSS